MPWRQGVNHQELNALGALVARLIRLVALKQLNRVQAQLNAFGAKTNLAEVYKEFVKTEATTNIITTNKGTF